MSKISPAANSIVAFSWDFGDGSSPNTTDNAPTHTYATTGDYKVCLTFTDNTGCSNTHCDWVHVQKEEHCCKKWSHAKEYVLNLGNGDREIKCTLWNETYIGIWTTHGARTRYFEKNSNGKWKKKRMATLTTTAGGTWWLSSDDGVCKDSQTGSESDIETNAHMCDVVWRDWGIWKLDKKSVASLHDAYDNSFTHIFTKDLTICDDNCK